jgi:hypothetical protein
VVIDREAVICGYRLRHLIAGLLGQLSVKILCGGGMKSKSLLVAALVTLAFSPSAHAGMAVVPDEFELQQQTGGPCDAYGTGFFLMPGTQTCARVSGQMRYEKHFSKGSGGQTMLDFETRSN